MVGFILNEKEIAEKLLNGEKVEKIKTYNKILILEKALYIQGITDRLELNEKILTLLNKVENNFKRVNWEETSLKAIDKMLKDITRFKKEIKLTDINKISITKKEMEAINSGKTKNIRKLLFVLLVYAKITNIILDRTDGWINQDIKNIFKEAKITKAINSRKKLDIFHMLYEKEYIAKKISTGSKSLKVNYIDNDIDSEIAFEVTDLADCHAIYSYLIYIGEKWKKCEVCGKYIKEGKTKKIKYCSDCAKKINLEKTKMNLRENIKMKK